jgi:putative glutamine amidotransferase
VSAPRIGIGGVVRTWDGGERTGVNTAYARAVLAGGGIPVLLSPLIGASHAARALDGLDGLLLTGGEDIDPEWYGEEPSPLLFPPNRERDLFELALFAAARQEGLPILGICRGIQLINVALGGTLYQDLPSQRAGTVDHRPAGERGTAVHRVRLAASSRAARALRTDEVTVNSIHHQGIKDLAPRLIATGWSEDGLIEAVETPPDAPWLLAVQWHPEEMHADVRAPDVGLFRALAEQACVSVNASPNPAAPDPAIGTAERTPDHSPR